MDVRADLLVGRSKNLSARHKFCDAEISVIAVFQKCQKVRERIQKMNNAAIIIPICCVFLMSCQKDETQELTQELIHKQNNEMQELIHKQQVEANRLEQEKKQRVEEAKIQQEKIDNLLDALSHANNEEDRKAIEQQLNTERKKIQQ